MKKVFLGLLIFIATASIAQKKVQIVTKPLTASSPKVFKSLLDSFSYAAGYSIASNMKAQNIAKINSTILQKGIDDFFSGKVPLINGEQMNGVMQREMQQCTQESASKEIAKGKAFLAKNKTRKEIITLPNGLQYEVLKKSDTGVVKPKVSDTVVVNYVGTLIDGTEFDNSYKRGMAATFPLGNVIKGWTEILQLMTPGDKWKVYIPTELGYYLSPRDPKTIPPGAALIFEISLEGIKPSVTK